MILSEDDRFDGVFTYGQYEGMDGAFIAIQITLHKQTWLLYQFCLLMYSNIRWKRTWIIFSDSGKPSIKAGCFGNFFHLTSPFSNLLTH
jgi:hypothetical protein